ncbi:MAG TPA: hypothetical protein VFI84_02150 [Candidatus Saccharimonadales bacterium]|nr:hypothetical protein [Candidatus Saccharimonadales bacterium]
MSFESFNADDTESIQAEMGLLISIQKEHAAQLNRSGALAKARDVVLEDFGRLSRREIAEDELGFNDLTQVSVAWHANPFTNHYRIPSIRFSTPQYTEDGFQFAKHYYAPLVEKIDDERRIRFPFSNEDYDTVISMLNGLEEVKELGILPHLGHDMATIFNPNTAIAKQA